MTVRNNAFTQSVIYATRNLFNAILNGDRGYQAPYPQDGQSASVEARAMLANKGPRVLAQAPAVELRINVVPQAADWVHAASESRMLPAFCLEAASGGWVAAPYCYDPPPNIPNIIIPQAQWETEVGNINIQGLTSGQPVLGMGYPTVTNFPVPGEFGTAGEFVNINASELQQGM
jgi:hypothetical protein